MLRIPYHSEHFPFSTGVSNGPGILAVSWGELLRAAVTVGRPNRSCIFQHGDASVYEAIFRLSLVRMALEQNSPTTSRLRRTMAARTLDPTEKGAVNYFLGMAVCKLFAEMLLDTPWLLHLDVFRPQLNAVLAGRSRPDLVGESNAGHWTAFEAKGRISPPDKTVKDTAKEQANKCRSINGSPVSLHVGAIAYFSSETLTFYWKDPPPKPESPAGFDLTVRDEYWRYYYEPIFRYASAQQNQSLPTFALLDSIDITVKIDPTVEGFLLEERWADAKRWCTAYRNELLESRFAVDGLRIDVGPSWNDKFIDVGL
jgi:hypothetical protein